MAHAGTRRHKCSGCVAIENEGHFIYWDNMPEFSAILANIQNRRIVQRTIPSRFVCGASLSLDRGTFSLTRIFALVDSRIRVEVLAAHVHSSNNTNSWQHPPSDTKTPVATIRTGFQLAPRSYTLSYCFSRCTLPESVFHDGSQ